jgi:quaternary ammonium compound-resistance protein SugE
MLLHGWTALILAGFMEIAFTTFMKLSEDFTRQLYSALFLVCSMASFYLLSRAMVTIPLGTAYAVWTGIGAVGTAVVGILFFGDPVSLARGFFLVTLIGSIAGLKAGS